MYIYTMPNYMFIKRSVKHMCKYMDMEYVIWCLKWGSIPKMDKYGITFVLGLATKIPLDPHNSVAVWISLSHTHLITVMARQSLLVIMTTTININIHISTTRAIWFSMSWSRSSPSSSPSSSSPSSSPSSLPWKSYKNGWFGGTPMT